MSDTDNPKMQPAPERSSIAALFQAMKEIADSKQESGTIVCPKCGGALRFSVASNGHQMAKCATPGCIAYMN